MLEGRGRVSEGRFDLKKDPGGIADIEFMVQFRILAHAHEYPLLTEFTDNIRQLDGLEYCSLVSAEDAQFLRDNYRVFRDKIHSLSLQGEPAVVDETQFKEQRTRIRQLWHDLMGVE
jgi:glutamate-ammonia-ligase adenylyltransferase